MFSRTASARRARSGIVFHRLISFVETDTLFYWSLALKIRFEAAYVVTVARFCALRAPGAREVGYFFMDGFLLPRGSLYFIGS